jgi:tetratricopeptide (TPR) repeat protein
MTAREGDALDAADRAFALAKEALGVDRDDVGALLALAVLTRNGWTRQMTAQPLTTGQRAAAAIGFVRAALVSDPNDPAALTALGDHYRRYEWRWAEAENLFRRALAIDPNLPEAHWSYAYMLGTQGRGIEGLAQAKKLFRLDPETAWRRVALPRLLYIAGDRAGALRRYDSELALAPDNLFLIREAYLIHLSEGDAAGLAGLRATVGRLWQSRPIPAGVTALASRIEAARAALSGRPQALLASVDADVAAFDAPASGPSATQQGRASVDLLYVYALEYAWAGRSGRALDLLERALAARSLYWPATLPYGRAEFPQGVRKDPRYAALWRSDPRLQELIQTRLRSLASRQMTGTLPDGARVTGSAT